MLKEKTIEKFNTSSDSRTGRLFSIHLHAKYIILSPVNKRRGERIIGNAGISKGDKGSGFEKRDWTLTK